MARDGARTMNLDPFASTVDLRGLAKSGSGAFMPARIWEKNPIPDRPSEARWIQRIV